MLTKQITVQYKSDTFSGIKAALAVPGIKGECWPFSTDQGNRWTALLHLQFAEQGVGLAPLDEHLLPAMNLKKSKDLRSVVSVAINVNRSDELLIAFGSVKCHWNDKWLARWNCHIPYCPNTLHKFLPPCFPCIAFYLKGFLPPQPSNPFYLKSINSTLSDIYLMKPSSKNQTSNNSLPFQH